MEARYGDLGGLREAGKEKGIELSEGDVRLAELAIFKKAYRLRQGARLSEQDALLLAARGPHGRRQAAVVAPGREGRRRHRGHRAAALHRRVHQLPAPENLTFAKGRIEVDPPKDVMDKLLRIPYFERAYEEDVTQGRERDSRRSHRKASASSLVRHPSRDS